MSNRFPLFEKGALLLTAAGASTVVIATAAALKYITSSKPTKEEQEIEQLSESDTLKSVEKEEEQSIAGEENFDMDRHGSVFHTPPPTPEKCYSPYLRDDPLLSWSAEVEAAMKPETLAAIMRSQCSISSTGSCISNISDRTASISSPAHADDEELRQVMGYRYTDNLRQQLNVATASPANSEISQDSGKGASVAPGSTVASPFDDFEVPPMYEFEIPQDLVGKLIGIRGTTVKNLMYETGTHIVVRTHFAKHTHKICAIEGSRENINKCLRLIRRRFPPSEFPQLKLTPLLVPVNRPVPSYPDYQLRLPQGVKCEVLVSCIESAGHFFVQQPTHPTFSCLQRLEHFMRTVYSQQDGVPDVPRPFDVNIICVAPLETGWFRAQIVKVNDETDEVTVKLVDYGGYVVMSALSLKQIRSDFMDLPFQAIECRLAHVAPPEGTADWSQNAWDILEQSVQNGRMLNAIVVGQVDDGSVCVELYDPTSIMEDGQEEMINRTLVSHGVAQWISPQ